MCPLGSSEPTVCPGGYYQNEIGRSVCKTCPAGFLCPIGTITPADLCPVSEFCVAGNYRGAKCDNGTYGLTEGLISQSECTDCPAGEYCQQGVVSGNCSSGFFCKIGQATASPEYNVSYADAENLLHALRELDGGPCYPGHYCPVGTHTPVTCPNSTVRADAYGAVSTDCGPCPAGYTCTLGDPVPNVCNKGYYCPEGESAIACPTGTYNPSIIKSTLDDCLDCPAGYYCNETAITTFANWPCPTGQFCLTGTVDPLPCPSGTFRNKVGAANQTDCDVCPPGRYCPIETSVYLTCPQGYYCPAGASNITLCPPGYTCGTNTSEPEACPESYYCPLGTHTPLECYYGTYCPTGTDFPIPCPLGYKAVGAPNNTLSVLSLLETACEACPAGYYGTDSERLSCSEGTQGYYFLGATTSATPTNLTTELGAICPVGHYCPAGSSEPQACPVGYYLGSTGAYNSSQCTMCDTDTYQTDKGSEFCLKCSSSSLADQGSSQCTCVGENRVFQPTDGYCICKPGYEFVNNLLEVFSEEDGSFDCQPMVRDRCATTDVRLFDGSCATDSYCDGFCGSDGGTLNAPTGTCLCSNITTLAEACDVDCRSNATTIACDSNGDLVATDPATGLTTVIDPDDLDSQGSIDCSTSGSSIYSMSTTAGSFRGIFGVNDALTTAITRRRRLNTLESEGFVSAPGISVAGLRNGTFFFDQHDQPRRMLETSDDASIDNPVVSISLGDTLIFDVTNDNYPVYVKDSLLNTNDDFDYSDFRELALAAKTSITITTFSYTFTAAGTYVLMLSSDATSITLITVLASSVTRSIAAQFVDFSDGNLILLGIKSDNTIVVTPDWDLVVGLLLGIMGVVLLLIGLLYYLRKRSWSRSAWHGMPKRDKKDKKKEKEDAKKGWCLPLCVPHFNNKVFASDNEDDMDVPPSGLEDMESPDLDDDELDDAMLIPGLAKSMQSHKDEIDKQLLSQGGLLAALQNTLTKEVDELKSLLNTTAMDIAMTIGKDNKSSRLRTILLQLKSDCGARGVFESDVLTTSKRILSLIDQVRKTLDLGSAQLGRSIVAEVVQQVTAAFERGEPLPTDAKSSMLTELVASLLEVKDFTDSVLAITMVEEKRRQRAATECFDHAIRSSRDINFPQIICAHLHDSKAADTVTDGAYTGIVEVLQAFSNNIPIFLAMVTDGEAHLVKGLGRVVEKGNRSQVDREQMVSAKTLSSQLSDLSDAMKVLNLTVEGRGAPSAAKCKKGGVRREELVAAIDAALAGIPGSDDRMQQMLEPLLAALKEAGSLNVAPAGYTPPHVGEDVGDVSFGEADFGAEMHVEENEIDQEMLESVLNNENLTESQKENILGGAESDLKVMEGMIELERKKQEEALNAAMDEHAVDEGEEEDSAHAAEQQALMASLLAARTEELDSMMAADEGGDDEAMQEKRILCLARSRYAAFMRYWAVHARLSYKELHTQFELERVQLQIKMNDAKSPIAREVGEGELHDLTAEEEAEVGNLSASLATMLEEGEAAEKNQQQQWMKQADLVNVKLQEEQLSTEYRAQFDTLRTRLQDLSLNIRDHCKSSGALTLAMLASRKSTIEAPAYAAMVDLGRSKIEASKFAIEALQEDDLRILSAEEGQLFEMLQHASAWDGKSEERAQQSQLHMRELGGIHVNSNIQNRLAMVEFELRAEYEQIRAANGLLKRGADKDEVTRVMSEMSGKTARDTVTLMQTLSEKLGAVNAAELERQQTAGINYEKERARAFSQNAQREITVSIQMYRSVRLASGEIEQVLAEKKVILLEQLQSSSKSEEVKELTVRHIGAECLREELELLTAYDSFEEGYKICERYLCEVVQGLQPSTAYIARLVQLYGAKELSLMQHSLYMEDARRRLKKQVAAHAFKAFESERLQALGRSEEEIQRLCDDVDGHTREMLALVEVGTSAEVHRMKTSQAKKVEEKREIHREYEAEVAELAKENAEQRAFLRAKFDSDNGLLQASADVSDGAVFRLLQAYTVQLVGEGLQHTWGLNSSFKKVMGKIVTEEATADEIRVLKQRLNNETEALEEVLDDSATARMVELLQNQKERREGEMAAYQAASEDFTERATELAAKEDEESIALRADLREKEQAFHSMGGESANAILDAAFDASRATKRNTEAEVRNLREQYDQDVRKLEESLADNAKKEKSSLQKRLAAKRDKRISELTEGGKSATEAQAIQAAEEQREVAALAEQLEAQRVEAVGSKQRDALEAESRLIAKEHDAATAASQSAQAERDTAQERMQGIRRSHEDQAKQLESAMLAERKAHEEALKARLAEKRAAKLLKIDDSAERELEDARLKKEEHENMLELQHRAAEEDEQRREQNRVAAEAEEAELREQLKQAEIEAAKATAREAAIRAMADIQSQAEEDIAVREVQRMRDMHEKQEERRKAEQETQKKASKGKMEERLAAKRAKRELELKEQEETALFELKAKHEKDSEEREVSRLAKQAWTEKVQEVVEKAKSLGLSDLEREDYCFKETLGKGMVPEKQFNEAVNLVQKERHDAEMKAVLTHNFEERIAALKGAVEEVLANKSKAKIDLVEGLAGNGATDSSIAEAVAALDAEFHAKQVDAENAAISQLEGVHLSKQMDLRQRQLQELANVVALYTDPDSLAHLSSTGLTQEEELLAYKAKIELEKKTREEAIRKERAETERAMRERMKNEMKKIQDDLAAEQKKGDQDFQRKKKEMERQKEEMLKKQTDPDGELDKAEKARILSSFEKEQAAALSAMDADRLNKKAKLAERLNRRKGGKAASTGEKGAAGSEAAAPTGSPPPGLQTSSAAVQSAKAQAAVSAISAKIADISSNIAAVPGETNPVVARSMQLIEGKLEHIERVIMTLEKKGISSPAQVASGGGGPYLDRDEPVPGESLEIMPEADVQLADLARIDFGKRLATMIGLKSLNIRAAYSLPPSTASGNAFCNSYFYDSVDNTLLVHTNRLSSSGDFGLVVIHALSHIKVNPSDLSNDTDPTFVAEFYRNLKLLSQDLYKKSAQSNQKAPAKVFATTPAKPKRLFKGSSFGAKAGLEVLVDAAGAPAAYAPADLFTADSVHSRMKVYAKQGGVPMEFLERYAAGRNVVPAPAPALPGERTSPQLAVDIE